MSKLNDVEFLKALATDHRGVTAKQLSEIADRLGRMESALKPFAELLPGNLDVVGGGTLVAPEVRVQWIKDAREAIGQPHKPGT